MSFLIDPPLLFLSGIAIFLAGRRLEWNRHAKIVVAAAVVLTFVCFSALLYSDMIRCVFPFFDHLKGSEFMLHSNFTNIHKEDLPPTLPYLLFLLYPLWIFAGYALALTSSKRLLRSNKVYRLNDIKRRAREGPSVYAVARDPDPAKCLRLAMDSLGGIERFVRKGDKVLIKVNICGGVPEIEGTFTSPEIVGELVNLISSVGGEPRIADADMIWTKFESAAADSGWTRWAKEKNVRLENLSSTRIAALDFGEGSSIGRVRISQVMMDADVIISVPAMKTHLLTGVTLGMKNMYGTFPDIDKAKFHQMGIEETIYQINRAFPPDLTVIDGSVGGETVGPLSCIPLNFQTVVASNDVVTADSIASQLMGFDPQDITHIRIAQERGLGDASQKFEMESLPYRHPGGKDGDWQRPDPKVKDFYEWGIELLLKIPGWDTLFNLGADFFLYDLARLPVIRNFTQAFLRMLNDLVYHLQRDLRNTWEDRVRRRTNLMIVLFLALATFMGLYLDGYLWHITFLFSTGLLAALALGAICAMRMRTRHLVWLLIWAGATGAAVEHTNMAAGLLKYTGSEGISLFIISGWMLQMLVILELSDLLAGWIYGLGIFQRMQRWNILPFALSILLFAVFMTWEGYLAVAAGGDGSNDGLFGLSKILEGDSSAAGRWVFVMYIAMAALGLLYSRRQTIEWNASILISSLVLGGYMELVGSLAGFWTYHFEETLAIFMILSWAINTWAVHGLAYQTGVDLGDAGSRFLFKPSSDDS